MTKSPRIAAKLLEVSFEDLDLKTAGPRRPTAAQPKDSQQSGGEEDNNDAPIPLEVALETVETLIQLLGHMLWSTLLITANTFQATFAVIKGVIGIDWLVVCRVSSCWLRFALHAWQAFRFAGEVFLLNIVHRIQETADANDAELYEIWGIPRDQPAQGVDDKGPVVRVHSFLPLSTSKNRYSGSSSFVSNPSNDEEQMSDDREGDIPVSYSQHRTSIPKSRTFSVFSNLTQSFSLGSIASRGTGSRNVSGESHVSNINPVSQPVHQPHSRPQPETNYPASPTLVPSSPPPTAFLAASPSSIKEITTAMPPQYWAGRFMALHDRIHNELLEPHNLARVYKTQAAAQCPTTASSASQAAAENNPSKSIYAAPRAAQTNKNSRVSGQQRYHQPSRIPQSATSGAIIQSSAYKAHTPHYSPSSTILRTSTNENTIPEHAPTVYTIPSTTSTNCHPTTLHLTPQDLPLAPTQPTHTTQPPQDDDQTRAHRVLALLASHCTTPAALGSLHAWQTEWFLRQNRRQNLLPGTTTNSNNGTCGARIVSISGETILAKPLPITVLVAAAKAGPVPHQGQDPPLQWAEDKAKAGCEVATAAGESEPAGGEEEAALAEKGVQQRQQQQQRGHEFGRRRREMVRRLRRGLGGRGVGGGEGKRGVSIKERRDGEGVEDMDLEGKEKRDRKRFSFF